MTDLPILFSGAMVRAILAGTKTQTRRVLKPQPVNYLPEWPPHYDRATGGAMWGSIRGDHGVACPYGKPGERLWVRESCFIDDRRIVLYRADGYLDVAHYKRTPSIHMPRWACRLLLEVTAVRVERLQAISGADAEAEGVELSGGAALFPQVNRADKMRDAYRALWDSMNAKRGYGWQTNPWVWVVEFKRFDPTANMPPGDARAVAEGHDFGGSDFP